MLVFRALTYVLPIPLGVLTYVFWQRNKSWRRRAEHRAAHRPGARVGMTTAARSRRAAGVVRRPRDVVAGRRSARRCCVLAALPVHPDSVSRAETAVFPSLNGDDRAALRRRLAGDAAGQLRRRARARRWWPPAFRRWRLAGALLLAGAGVYLLAKR